MFTLALLLALSAPKPIVVCVGFTGPRCDFTYTKPADMEADSEQLRKAAILIEKTPDGKFSPTDVTTAINSYRHQTDLLLQQVQGQRPYTKLLYPVLPPQEITVGGESRPLKFPARF